MTPAGWRRRVRDVGRDVGGWPLVGFVREEDVTFLVVVPPRVEELRALLLLRVRQPGDGGVPAPTRDRSCTRAAARRGVVGRG